MATLYNPAKLFLGSCVGLAAGGYDAAMPDKGKSGKFAPLPSTLERSPAKAQDTYEDTLEHAEQEYAGDEARAHRVAWAAVKHSFEKHGDHWEPKQQLGPSDPRAVIGGPGESGAAYGGVDIEGRTKDDLLDEAQRRGVRVTTHMRKDEIAKALERANDSDTRKARE
jgi:cation transport regulator ChaB